VYADTRTANHLLPFKFPKHALEADLNVFRRAKSDDEISSIQRMSGILKASREHARDEQHFRGTVDSLNYRHAVQERAGTEFTLKRYGLQDELGRSVELSSVEPHTLDWKARMLRVDDGCRAVEKELREGATGMDIDRTFRSHLDPTADVIYGSVLHHTGYQPWEDDLEVDVLKPYDVLTICPIVGDTQGNSVPYMHSVHAITDQQFRGATASYDALFRGNPENMQKVVTIWKAMGPKAPEGGYDGSFVDMMDDEIDTIITELYKKYNETPGAAERVASVDVSPLLPHIMFKGLIKLSALVTYGKIKLTQAQKHYVALAIGLVFAPPTLQKEMGETPLGKAVLQYVLQHILQPLKQDLKTIVLVHEDGEVVDDSSVLSEPEKELDARTTVREESEMSELVAPQDMFAQFNAQQQSSQTYKSRDRLFIQGSFLTSADPRGRPSWG
jgi:hypothetical protein